MGFEVVKPDRPQIFDRPNYNATGIIFTGDAVAPHAITTRATYTTPAGFLAEVENSVAQIIRATAAGTVGRALAVVNAFGTNRTAAAWIRTNAIGDKDSMGTARGIVLEAAEIISIITEDLSTTGTIDYRLACSIGESDA